MRGVRKIQAATCLLSLGAVCLAGGVSRAAEDDPGGGQLELIIEYISDAERATRAMGLQYVRDDVPGEAATKAFAGLLPKLSPEAQVDLLDALGDRDDAAARPAVLDMLGSDREAVRAAVLRALGALGSTAEVPLLAGKAAAGSAPEKKAARRSLARLRGDKINAAIVSAMDAGEPDVRVALLDVLAMRNAKEALPAVLKATEDADGAVRLAALGALRFLAGEQETAAVVKTVKGAKDTPQRRKAELALLALCSRSRQKCAAAIIEGLADADAPSRVALLRALARASGPEALEAIVARLKDDDEAVRDQAVRMLSSWPDRAAAPHLKEIAKQKDNLRHHVLAIRGLIRLGSPKKDQPADLDVLSGAMGLASRAQEKRLALAALGSVATPESLALVAPALDDPELAEDAALAAVTIAEKMEDGKKDGVRSALEKVVKQAKTREVRGRAEKVLKSL